MKVFEYTARDETGATRKDTISATDRLAAIAELRKRNLVTLSLVEAKGMSATKNGRDFRINKVSRLSFFAVLMISAVILTAYLISQHNGIQKEKLHKVAKTSIQKKGASNTAGTQGSGKKVQNLLPGQTNTVSSGAKKSRSPADIAKEYEAARATNNVAALRPPPVFTMAIESLMHAASVTPPGLPPIPLPPITSSIDESFIHSLTNNIVIYDEDSEKMAKLKEETAYVKLEMAKYVAEGYTAKQVLEAIQEERKEQHKFRKELYTEMMALFKAERADDAKAYLSEANAILNERGIVPLSIPREFEQKPVQ
ncbi:MAG: hypothetical protein WCP12_10205 [bacterium]